MSVHRFTAVAVLAIVLAGASAVAEPQGRVVILGFDGADPGVVGEMIQAGELPNLQKLSESGDFQPLGSSSPPQSPTAWSSFATCKNPLNHGIYDFLRRNPSNYFPAVGFGRTTKAELNPDGSLKSPPRYENNRLGDSFWKVASDSGLKVKALVVPFAYPAEDLSDECRQLCGLDVPDIRGTQSTYFAFSEGFSKEEPTAGGMRLPLNLTDGPATVNVPGIAVPGTRPPKYVDVPVTFTADRAGKTVSIDIQGTTVTLGEGEWSAWQEWSFAVTDQYTVKAVSRFHCMSAGDEVRVYMTCLQIHPEDPMMPISSPGFSAELAKRYGLFKTIGWVYDTKALQQDDMSEEMFLDDVRTTMAWREQLCLDELDAGNFDLLVSAWTGTDRVGHMFWAYRDPKHPLYTPEKAAKYGKVLEETYVKMDSIVGKVMQRLNDNDLLIIMSDHGFHSFRRAFSVNTWLIENGYLATKNGASYTDTKYLQGYDWSKSKAYGLGLGMIFLNLQGREAQGTVAKADAPALIQEISDKLMTVTDPESGDKVFGALYPNINPKGAALADAPDIQLGYAEGFQTNKSSAAGAAPQALFEDNDDKWSGEHASSDVATTHGILLSNQKLGSDPSLIDLGVTALKYLGQDAPADFEGKPLL